jgi:hypothetical protein
MIVQWGQIKFGIFIGYNKKPTNLPTTISCIASCKQELLVHNFAFVELQIMRVGSQLCFWGATDYESWQIVLVDVLVAAENPKLYLTPLYNHCNSWLLVFLMTLLFKKIKIGLSLESRLSYLQLFLLVSQRRLVTYLRKHENFPYFVLKASYYWL